jgi:hypothetical protein
LVSSELIVVQFYHRNSYQYKGLWYVLAAYDDENGIWFNTGGNNDVLTGQADNWGGLTIGDIIISAVEGFLLSGSNNGFSMEPWMFNTPDGTSPLPFSAGVQTPGFFEIPICQIYSANWATQWNEAGFPYGDIDEQTYPHFPCKN